MQSYVCVTLFFNILSIDHQMEYVKIVTSLDLATCLLPTLQKYPPTRVICRFGTLRGLQTEALCHLFSSELMEEIQVSLLLVWSQSPQGSKLFCAIPHSLNVC